MNEIFRTRNRSKAVKEFATEFVTFIVAAAAFIAMLVVFVLLLPDKAYGDQPKRVSLLYEQVYTATAPDGSTQGSAAPSAIDPGTMYLRAPGGAVRARIRATDNEAVRYIFANGHETIGKVVHDDATDSYAVYDNAGKRTHRIEKDSNGRTYSVYNNAGRRVSTLGQWRHPNP